MSLLLVLAALVTPPVFVEDVIKFEVKDAVFDPKDSDLIGYNDGEEKAFYYINGSATVKGKVPADGEYILTINASCTSAENENAKITIHVGDKQIVTDFLLTTEDQKDYEFTVTAKAGEVKVKVTYTNDIYKEGEHDRNFYLHEVTMKKKK
ncbi:MAG TPA: carbohydrate-binding domain-containing protein [Gemmatales bacterium]|nr:carbohydrate-binding domain-containing protein [Gemmatales bacterium]HMP15411.1 carbohydrate-binding domain-containing protein [Gemmatales bacterium]